MSTWRGGCALHAGVQCPERRREAPVHMLEYRRMLVDGQTVEVTKPGQRLIDTVVAGPRLVWRRGLGRRGPGHGLGRSHAASVTLYQAALLPSAPRPRACAGSPTNATARSRQGGSPGAPAACPGPPLKVRSCTMDTVWKAR